MLSLIGIIAASLIVCTLGQLDPVLNYCTRYDHQCKDFTELRFLVERTDWNVAVVKNNTLYIDGGKQTFIQVNSDGKQEGDITVGISRDALDRFEARLTWVNRRVSYCCRPI